MCFFVKNGISAEGGENALLPVKQRTLGVATTVATLK